MNCVICGCEIPLGRLKAIPNTKTCTSCSNTDRYGCINVINHKTGNEIQILSDRKLAEKINKMAYRQTYGICNGVRMNKK